MLEPSRLIALTGSFRKIIPRNIAHTVIRLPRLEKIAIGNTDAL